MLHGVAWWPAPWRRHHLTYTYYLRYKTEINAEPNTVRVIKKADVAPAMLKALLVDEWPVWFSKTGGWPDLNHPYEYEHPLRVSVDEAPSSCVEDLLWHGILGRFLSS